MNPENASQTAAGVLYWGTRAFVALSIPVFLFQAHWSQAAGAAAIFALMFLPEFLQRESRVYIPFQLDAAIVVFIFCTLFLGSLANFYEMYPWWDKLLHFLSGFLIAIGALVVIYILREKPNAKLKLNAFFASVFAVCFSSALSVVWEIYEFTADRLFGFNMQRDGLNDTMSDLILNLVASHKNTTTNNTKQHKRKKKTQHTSVSHKQKKNKKNKQKKPNKHKKQPHKKKKSTKSSTLKIHSSMEHLNKAFERFVYFVKFWMLRAIGSEKDIGGVRVILIRNGRVVLLRHWLEKYERQLQRGGIN